MGFYYFKYFVKIKIFHYTKCTRMYVTAQYLRHCVCRSSRQWRQTVAQYQCTQESQL